MPELKLIIFDMDGTIADTERYGHLPASNEAMRMLGLDIQWSWSEFKRLLPIPGNANRLRETLKNRNFKEDEIEAVVQKFEPLKKQLYIEKYLPELEPRKGIRQLIDGALQKNLKLAIVSTSYESQIRAFINSKLPDFARHFKVILGKESGQKTENNGYLYRKCLTLMHCAPEDALAIEDSAEGLEAAVSAGITTVVFYNEYTFGSNFRNAKLVAPSAEYFDMDFLIKIWKHSFF